MSTSIARIARADVPNEMIKNCMEAVFGAAKRDDYYKFDFMYIAYGDDMKPECFTFCQEQSNEKIWLAFGGAVPDERGIKTIRSFKRMIDELFVLYPQIGAQVENVNHAMLKIYIANGFNIVGTRLNHEKRLFVEFCKERENG